LNEQKTMPAPLDERPWLAGTQRPGRHRLPGVRLAAAMPVAGLVLVALNLRIGVASVGPVLTTVRDDLGLSSTVASLLTTIPVVAFGAFAFFAPGLIRRLGLHRLLGLAMAALTAGIALRLQPSPVALFAGTIVIGAAIAIACAAMPAVIKQDYPGRVGPLMGLYSTSLFLSACIADGLTVPLTSALGGRWRSALALWCIPAAVAFVAWWPQFSRRPVPPSPSPTAARAGASSLRALLTDPVAIAVTAFMGIQSIGYYVTLTWLPTLLQDDGMNPHRAGWMLSYSAFPGIAVALVSPGLARRVRPTWIPVALAAACYGLAYAGLAAAPVRGAYLWMTLLGLGQGASISLALSYVAWRSLDVRSTAQLSTMAQGFGYLLASLGPIGIGAVHGITGNWTLPLIVLGALLVPQLVAGALASRERFVLSPHTIPPPPVPALAASERPTRPEELPVNGSETGAMAWDDIVSRWSSPSADAVASLPRQRSAGRGEPGSGGGMPAGQE
jgi:CP family cyanate transporter-like MFS transporter